MEGCSKQSRVRILLPGHADKLPAYMDLKFFERTEMNNKVFPNDRKTYFSTRTANLIGIGIMLAMIAVAKGWPWG